MSFWLFLLALLITLVYFAPIQYNYTQTASLTYSA